MDLYEEIDYWMNLIDAELHCFETEERKEIVRKIYRFFADTNNLFYYYLPDKKGMISYSFTFDSKGVMALHELFMYIKPEHRGSFKLFRELIKHVEQAAKEKNCRSIRIGANLNFKDEKILIALKYFGYAPDTVVKYL